MAIYPDRQHQPAPCAAHRAGKAESVVDFCLKLNKMGYYNVFLPHVQLFHHESKSRGHDATLEKQIRFRKEIDFMRKRWGDIIADDPYYNPNLTLSREDCSIRGVENEHDQINEGK